jgi:hypothetical protein
VDDVGVGLLQANLEDRAADCVDEFLERAQDVSDLMRGGGPPSWAAPKGVQSTGRFRLRRAKAARLPGLGRPDKILPQDRHLRRGLDAEADDPGLEGHDLDGDAEAGEDDLLLQPARQDEHDGTPFRRRAGVGR